jgi:hypothetical protein
MILSENKRILRKKGSKNFEANKRNACETDLCSLRFALKRKKKYRRKSNTLVRKQTTAGTIKSRDVNNSRQKNATNIGTTTRRDISRYPRNETTAVRITATAGQQHKRQLKNQGTPTTAIMPKSLETPLAEGLLTTIRTPATAGNRQQHVPKTAGTPARAELLPRRVIDISSRKNYSNSRVDSSIRENQSPQSWKPYGGT